jgi:hypothetical protein
VRYRAIGIFDGCKPLKMGVFRKPRFSKDDVEKVTDGFFNKLLVVKEAGAGETKPQTSPTPALRCPVD